jgi:hypothetical protein
MGIILTSAGLPLLTARGLAAAVPVPVPRPDEVVLLGPVAALTHRGVTIGLSTPLPYFLSANGDPVFVTTSASSITAFPSHPSMPDAQGYQHSGAMKNPSEPQDGDRQGFDQAMEAPGPSGSYPYDPGLNVDPGANGGAAVPVARGSSFTIVKAVRDGGWKPGAWKSVRKYVVFTFMGSAPPGAGRWFRPPVSTRAKTYPGRVEDLVLSGPASPLRHLGRPPVVASASACLQDIAARDLVTPPIWNTTAESGRRAQLTGEEPSSGYSASHADDRGKYACALHVDPGPDQREIEARRELAVVLTQWGIDVDGAHQMGQNHASGAGQWFGYIEFYYIAAFLLGDAAMLGRAQAHRSNAIGQYFWVPETLVGYPTYWHPGSAGGNGGYAGMTYMAEHLGKPEWSHEPQDAEPLQKVPGGDPRRHSASIYAVYRNTNAGNQAWELIPICLLRNGPSGETGVDAVNGDGLGAKHGVHNRTAALPYLDRAAAFAPVKDTSNYQAEFYLGEALLVYDAWRDAIPQPRWTGAPDISASHDLPVFRAGNSGEIDWSRRDFTQRWTYHYATEPVLERQVGYSLDGIQFVDLSIGRDETRIIGGLRPGTQHWCRWRQRSASGWSPWSETWEQRVNGAGVYGTDRGVVGSGGAVPAGTEPLVNTVAPALHVKPYPAHEMPYYEPALGDMTKTARLYAGMGYWTGGAGALGAGYQWQRAQAGDGAGEGDFSDIAGATGQSYDRQAADSGCRVRCRVTVGGQAVATAPVSFPEAAAYPAGTIVETDFSTFAWDWPHIWQAMQAAAGAFVPKLLPGTQLTPDTSGGILWFHHNARNPSIAFDLATDAPEGTYTVVMDYGGGFYPHHSSDRVAEHDFVVQVLDGANAVRGECSWTVAKEKIAVPGYMTTLGGRFTLRGADRTVRFRTAVPGAAGMQSGTVGGPVLARLIIKQD